MSKPFQVGIVGYGLSARVFHIPYVLASPAFALRAIVQRHGDTAQKDHPDAVVYRDADALFADATVDLVVVTTPPASHIALASAALAAGKHVVVEKPFAAAAADCDGLIAQAAAAGRVLSVFQNRRWDADFVTLQRLLADGALGRVVELESHFDRYKALDAVPRAAWAVAPGQPATDAIYDVGTHLIDQVVTLLGLPARVTGVLQNQRGGAPYDAFTVLLHYPDGLLATVKATTLSAAADQLRFWVRGDRAAFRKCHMDPQEKQALQMGPQDPGFGVEPASHAGQLTVYGADGQLTTTTVPTVAPPPTYSQFYTLLAGALAGTGPVPVPAQEARNVIRLVELAEQSSREGRTLAWSE